MVKALLFDADGVVVNKLKLWSEHFAEDQGLDPVLVQTFFQNDFQPCLVGQADLKLVIKPHLARWGWQGTVDELLEYWFRVENSIDDRMMEKVQNYRRAGLVCYLATNQEKYRTEYMRRDMGLGDKFDGIFASAHLGSKKSDSSFWQAIEKSLAPIRPDQILLWDDDLTNVEAARAFGCQAELYKNFEEFLINMGKLGL